MDEQFDKNITDRVKEVFENYEDPFAHDSWLRLREKFPEKRRRRPVAWWWLGTAAALLLFFGIVLWLNKEQVPTKKLALKKGSPVKTERPYNLEKQVEKNNDLNPGNNPVNEEKIAGTGAHNKRTITVGERTITAGQNKAFDQQQHDRLAKALRRPIPGNGFGKNNPLTKQIADSVNHPAIKAQPEELTINARPKIAAADSAKHAGHPSGKSINSMFEQDQQLSKSNHTEKQKNDTKKVRFAVYAATYFNYAKGSDNQVNIGAGFTSDISLAKNLKLVTGVSIGQNSLSYSSPASFNAAVPASSSLLAGASASYYALFGNNVKTASPTLKNYNASLVGLDVPVNLKYAFDPQKSDTYILAGLSSGTFINETYTSQYSYPAQQTQDQVSHSSFNGFYFAKTLNLALGTGFNMGKNRIIVEPFLKYPLDGLGIQQLRFGAGGINLKFNFQPAKK